MLPVWSLDRTSWTDAAPLHSRPVQRGDGLILPTLSATFALTPKLKNFRCLKRTDSVKFIEYVLTAGVKPHRILCAWHWQDFSNTPISFASRWNAWRQRHRNPKSDTPRAPFAPLAPRGATFVLLHTFYVLLYLMQLCNFRASL
jgi:hypothetical protein